MVAIGGQHGFAVRLRNLRAFKRLMTEAILIAADSAHSVVNQEIFSGAFQEVFGKATMRSNPFV